MLSSLFRIIFSLTAVAPVFISLSYIFFKENNFISSFVSISICLLLGLISAWILEKSACSLEILSVKIKKAKNSDKETIGIYVAYVLPLLFKGQTNGDMGVWVLAVTLLIFVVWTTSALQINPLLSFFGFKFYEVETEDGMTYTLIARRRINDISTISSVVQISDYGLMEIKSEKQ